VNIQRFYGWIIICPHCEERDYISDEDIAFDPRGDREHIIQCEKCKKEFEVYLED
jgi:predicted Zn finger-like uncharacterized protein